MIIPHWIVENIVKEPSFLELSEAVRRANLPILDLRGDYAKAMVAEYQGRCVIFNGSIEMCKLVAPVLKAQGCSPVIYCSWENYLCTHWYSRLSAFLFNDDYVMVPFSEVQKRMWWFYRTFAKENMLFIRPDSGEKTFKAGIVDIEDFQTFYYHHEHERDSLVIVSSPKTIQGEWRFVVTDEQEIVAVSSYRYQGECIRVPSAPHGATALCKQILDANHGHHPDPVYCIDICEDADGNHWLMELTSFSSAGLYACNKDAIVKEISRKAAEHFTCEKLK